MRNKILWTLHCNALFYFKTNLLLTKIVDCKVHLNGTANTTLAKIWVHQRTTSARTKFNSTKKTHTQQSHGSSTKCTTRIYALAAVRTRDTITKTQRTPRAEYQTQHNQTHREHIAGWPDMDASKVKEIPQGNALRTR